MATPIVMPRLGDFMTEGTVTSWSKAPGDSVQQGEVVAQIETEKVSYDLEATASGILHPAVSEGDSVPVDGLLGYLLAEGESPPKPTAQQARPQSAFAPSARPSRPSARPAASGDVVPSTPGARRLATNLGVDVSEITPTGPRGRVTDADVRAYVDQKQRSEAPPGLPPPSKTISLAGIRKTIAGHMRNSISNTAQLSFFLEVDITEAQRMRREASRAHDTVVTTAHVLAKACAEALKRYPALNTVLAGDSIIYFDEISIGFAVSLEEGLIVPVIRKVGEKDIYEISNEMNELTEKARAGKLTPDDVAGGTFTISILGTVDGFTPILNAGQNALLGAGRSVQKPVVKSAEIVVREMMALSLTVDHQVVDGAAAAGFLRRLQQIIERPSPLFR